MERVPDTVSRPDESTKESSRVCDDGLAGLVEILGAVSDYLERPLRILDLECAQGFSSLGLAARGHEVHGIDSDPANVRLCRERASGFPAFAVRFSVADVESFVSTLACDSYDVVLGLKAFHDLKGPDGSALVTRLAALLAARVPIALLEVASVQPLAAGSSLQGRTFEGLFGAYAFSHPVITRQTDASLESRILVFCSNNYWYLSGQLEKFKTWTRESHSLVGEYYLGSRRYYFGKSTLAKVYDLNDERIAEVNRRDIETENSILQDPARSLPGSPAVLCIGKCSQRIWLVREKFEGTLLLDVIQSRQSFDHHLVFRDVLDQLVSWEERGLFHNDIRLWNVLMKPDGRAQLIDFGSLTTAKANADWLWNVFFDFAMFTREITQRKIWNRPRVYGGDLDVVALDESYRAAFIGLFSRPHRLWTFANLRAEIT